VLRLHFSSCPCAPPHPPPPPPTHTLLPMPKHALPPSHVACRPWQGWSRDALRGWGPILTLSLSSTLMVVLEWWIYDVNTLLAGLLGDPGEAFSVCFMRFSSLNFFRLVF
jgi:hypothetical protein